MIYLLLGALCFGGAHLFSIVLPRQRDALKAAIGVKAWPAVYAVTSLLGILFFILAYRSMGNGPLEENLYQPWPQGKHLVMLLALIMFILLGASMGKGYMRLYLRHPMSIGIALWAAGHLLVNGERAVVWLFATLLIVALADLVFSFSRGKKPDYVPEVKSDIKAVIIGVVVYAIFLFGFHPYVLGVPVVG